MADPIITKTIYVETEPVSAPKAPAKTNEKENPAVESVQKQEKANAYENVVATSKDGDTVQVKPEANERLADGFVFNKNQEEKKTEEVSSNKEEDAVSNQDEKEAWAQKSEKIADKTEDEKNERLREMIEDAREKSEETKENIRAQAKEAAQEDDADKKAEAKSQASINNASDQDLEQMYLEGKISSYAYNQEIASRKEENAEDKAEKDALSGKVTAAGAEMTENENLGKAVGAIENGTGYQTKEEQEAAMKAVFGTGNEDKDDPKNFEINIIR